MARIGDKGSGLRERRKAVGREDKESRPSKRRVKWWEAAMREVDLAREVKRWEGETRETYCRRCFL